MKILSTLLPSILFLYWNFKFCFSLKCYQCGTIDSGFGYDLDPCSEDDSAGFGITVFCSAGELCEKSIYKSAVIHGTSVSRRDCSACVEKDFEGVIDTIFQSGFKTTCCSTDLCNNTKIITFRILIMVFSLIFGFIGKEE